ncbi:hypothetical protein LUZ61_013143 [Rhynchospora tenuis]|uniref:C2H2-type domain-containing protein n=1 Tax=Rhynchospora tenuis TaxID=198213 RepID=A0AAD5Z2H8_9POAL|nr:hypothetical protein LUZ61_013143 [Rhynchospora tenuis]
MANSMKSFMIQQADDEPEDMANTLMLLSRSTHGCNARMFECKTCNRQFPSFQALGGHRASHRKPRHARCEEDQIPAEPTKPRVHECSICGLEFSLGQALGGHMRRHRAKGEGVNAKQERKWAGSGLNLDLNLAPPEVDVDCQEGIDLELHLDLEEKVRFVQWLH